MLAVYCRDLISTTFLYPFLNFGLLVFLPVFGECEPSGEIFLEILRLPGAVAFHLGRSKLACMGESVGEDY